MHEAHDVWRVITTDVFVLRVVDEGYNIQWVKGQRPQVPHDGINPPTSEDGKAILDQEVEAMLKKKAIRVADLRIHGAVSGFFARPKKVVGKWRPICSMKYTNKFIVYKKFRMTTTWNLTRWIRPGYFFASIDCSDAYFAIPLEESEAKYTRFRWRSITYEYLCIMFGLGPSARVFTKMMMAVIKFLRTAFGILIVAYIDDLLIQAADEAHAGCMRRSQSSSYKIWDTELTLQNRRSFRHARWNTSDSCGIPKT